MAVNFDVVCSGGDRGDADATAVNFNPGSSGGGAGGADNRSRVLWVRGVTRIQQQVSYHVRRLS